MEETLPRLWDKAFNTLPQETQKVLGFDRKSILQPPEVLHAVEQKKKDCEDKQWVLYTNEAGEKVKVRDTLEKVCSWLDTFKHLGDAAVQFDAGYAAIPWAAIRTLLQVAINDCETFGAMIEDAEAVSRIIARYTEIEARVLIRTSNLTKQLSTALVKLYRSSLEFLADAIKYYKKSSAKRFVKSLIKPKSMVEEDMHQIRMQEEEVFKLITLVEGDLDGVRIDDLVKNIRQSVESFRASDEERRKRLSAWINGIDTQGTYETALQYHQEGTCDWVLRLPEFRSWISDEDPGPRLLWIHGPAGFGKTILSAWIIKYLDEQKQAPLAYFYCVADNQLTRDPYAILRSWLTRLLERYDQALSITNSFFNTQNKGQASTHLVLWELFAVIGESIEGCTFVIDGFDECIDIDTGVRYHNNEPRSYFLRDMLECLRKTKARILVISRDVPDIREYLGMNSSAEGDTIARLEYGITAYDTTADVLAFSESIVNQKLPRKAEEQRQQIANQAAERSEGMFLWIQLLAQEISPGKNYKQLRDTVKEMPSGISDAYSRELEKIIRLPPQKKEKAVMILRWVLFAIRPLQVKQLAEALIVSDDDLDEYPRDDLPDAWDNGFVDEDYVKEQILGPCGSFLQLRRSYSESETPLADQTVHFVHFSVKEYLSNTSGAAVLERWSADLGLMDALVEETRLANICLRYLTLSIFEDIPKDTKSYPFLSYAAWAWYFHSFYEKPKPAQNILCQTQKAFDPATFSWKVWTPVMEAELTKDEMDEWEDDIVNVTDTESESDSETYGQSTNEGLQTPIYYASLLGLIDVVKWLEDQGIGYGPAGGRFGFPLQAAVARSHEELVKYLLNRRVDVSQKGGQFGASIIAAAAMSTSRIVEILLSAKADVTAVDESGWTALHHATKRGSVEIVELLLDHGADVNAAATHTTAASLACHFRHKDVLSILVQRGADLTIGDCNPKSVLHIAFRDEDEDLLDVLLNNGISANASFPDGSTALNRAAWSLTIVRKLLEAGADPNLADNKGWTPLISAAAHGDLDVIEALINAGAHIADEPDLGGEINPLQAAIINNHHSIAKWLFKHGASLDQRTKGGTTALLFAVSMPSQESQAIVVWLLDEGASMECISEHDQMSLFDTASEYSDDDMTQLLVRRGCFQVKAEGHSSQEVPARIRTWDDHSLVMLAYNGEADRVGDLLARGSGSLAAHILSEALHTASARGHLPIVKMLLKSGVRPDVKDINGRSALHHATRHLHFDVADLLVEHGANMSSEDVVGSTPIDLAIVHGKKAIQFIQNYMDALTMNISRRPSVLNMTPNQSTNLTAMGIRKAISGSWIGDYKYLSWSRDTEPFSINVPSKPRQGLSPFTFSNEGTDTIGDFEFHGFVDSIGKVWFVKLYDELGWLYCGHLDSSNESLKGTWGSNRKLWFGTFHLKKG